MTYCFREIECMLGSDLFGIETAGTNSRTLKDTVSSVQHFSAGTNLATVQKKKVC